MNRLQKKCLFAAAGTHLLIVVVVLCSGFISSKPKEDDAQLLDVIPSDVIDAKLNSGVKSATPPAPTPVVTPPTPTPEPPQPVVTPPKPADPVPPPVKPDMDLTPVTVPDKPIKPVKPQVKTDDFTPTKRTDADTAAVKKAAQDAQRKHDQQTKAFRDAMRSIKNNASSATTVEMPGTSSVSYANYASVVKSIYEREWTPPDSSASDDANVKVKVVINREGSVVSATIIGASGDSSVDGSVQRTLDHVHFIAPFPDGATENEKTFVINFNLKAKRMFG